MGRLNEDPFGTAQLRQRLLEAWTASPARFREDANAEEDLVLGGYRDRLVVELAQNAADAATAGGVPGYLRLTLTATELRAANVGAPLDGDGVQGLSTLRASAKAGSDSVGRYGVGFAAVLAVSEEPMVLSRSGGVRFSAKDTRTMVSEIASLATELARRDRADKGSVPVLRLPFPARISAAELPAGFDTEVRLPLRPGSHDRLRSMLDSIDADILLGLPDLTRLDIDGRVLQRSHDGSDVILHDGDAVQRWRTATATGVLPAELLAGRPVEEQERPQWTISWAVPLQHGLPRPLEGPQVIHAPTPSDEPLSLPVRLIATFPLAPDRRHIASGPVTDHLVREAATAFGDLIVGLVDPDHEDDPAVLALLPRPTLAATSLDGALGAAITSRLCEISWLPEAAALSPITSPQSPERSPARIRPDRATVIDSASPELVAALADMISGLLPASWSRRTAAPVLNTLGVRRLHLGGVIDLLTSVDRPPSWWALVYAGLERTGSFEDRDALAAMPIPLADSRMSFGARGLLMADRNTGDIDLTPLGLRLIHPDVTSNPEAANLLERLGATPATALSMLTSAEVRTAVETSYEADKPEPVARAVLALVAATGVTVQSDPWLAELALPDDDGEWTPAGELLLPDSELASVFEPDSLGFVGSQLVSEFGAAPLVGVGVLENFAVVRDEGSELGEVSHDLDAESRWCDAVLDRLPLDLLPPVRVDFVAVRDLDLVRADRWEAALRLLAKLPRDVFADVVASLGDGSTVEVASYPRWWLSTHPVLDGGRPDRLRHPDADQLAGLYDVARASTDVLAIVGCLWTIEDVLADPDTALDLLDRLGRTTRTIAPQLLLEIYPRLADALREIDVQPPERVRVTPTTTVEREDAVVVDAPYLLPLLDLTPVPAAAHPRLVADLLDIPMASELDEINAASVRSTPVSMTEWSDIPGSSLAARRLGLSSLSGVVAQHDPLRLDGDRPVSWWPGTDVDHVDVAGGASALGRALAWRHRRWSARSALAEAFAQPEDESRLAAEDGSA